MTRGAAPGIAWPAIAVLLIIAAPVAAQVPMTPVADLGPGQALGLVRVIGDRIFATAEGTVFILDATDPSSLQLVGALGTDEPPAQDIGLTASFLLVDAGGSVRAYDRRDGYRFVAQVALNGIGDSDPSSDILAFAGLSFFTTWDVSDASDPVSLDSLPLRTDFGTDAGDPFIVEAHDAADGYAIVRRGYSINLCIPQAPCWVHAVHYDFIDFTDPSAINLLGTSNDEYFPFSGTVLVADGMTYRYLSANGEWWGWPSPESPATAHRMFSASGGSIIRAGSQLRVLTGQGLSSGVQVVSAELQPLCSLAIDPPVDSNLLQATSDRLLWPGTESDLASRTFDCVSGLGQVELHPVGILASHAAQRGTVAFVTDPDLWAFDLSNPSQIRTVDRVSQLTGIPVPAGNGFVYAVESGLIRVIDANDPSALIDHGTVDLGAPAEHLASSGAITVALMLDSQGAGQLAVIDLSAPSSPAILSTFSPSATTWSPSSLGTVAVHPAGYAYVGYASDVWVVDLTDPLLPTQALVFSAANGAAAHRVFVESDRLWTSRSRDHSVYDLQDPGSPALLESIKLMDDPAPIDAVVPIPNAVIVSAGNAIQSFAIQQPFGLVEVATHSRNAASGSVAAYGRVVLDADAGSGLRVLSLESVTATPPALAGGGGLLLPNSPNPFPASTRLRWRIDRGTPHSLRVYDAAGRLVREWSSESLLLGALEWDGRDERGRPVASGVYLVRILAGKLTDTQRVVRLR